jgi:short-subunit dehydrogenase
VYSPTKAGMVGCREAMSRELNSDGVKSIALGPGFFDAHASDFIYGELDAADIMRSEDIAEAVRFALRLSPACVVLEIVFQRPRVTLWRRAHPRRSSSCFNSSAAGVSSCGALQWDERNRLQGVADARPGSTDEGLAPQVASR